MTLLYLTPKSMHLYHVNQLMWVMHKNSCIHLAGSSVSLPAALLAKSLLDAAHHDDRGLRMGLADLVAPVILSAMAEVGFATVDRARHILPSGARSTGPLQRTGWRNSHHHHFTMVFPLLWWFGVTWSSKLQINWTVYAISLTSMTAKWLNNSTRVGLSILLQFCRIPWWNFVVPFHQSSLVRPRVVFCPLSVTSLL